MNDVDNCALALDESLRCLSDSELDYVYALFETTNNLQSTDFNYRRYLESQSNDRTARAILSVFNFQLCANTAAARCLVERQILTRWREGMRANDTP